MKFLVRNLDRKYNLEGDLNQLTNNIVKLRKLRWNKISRTYRDFLNMFLLLKYLMKNRINRLLYVKLRNSIKHIWIKLLNHGHHMTFIIMI